jgi:hypothetical protein
MITSTTERDEIAAMSLQYQKVLAWEAEFAQQIEELSNIDSNDVEAFQVANEIIQTWEDRGNIKGKRINLALKSNHRKLDRLEAKLTELGYKFTAHNGLIRKNGKLIQTIKIEKV